MFKNGSFLSVVVLVSVTLIDSKPPRKKKNRIWHRLPPPPSRGQRQLNFPNVKNDAGQKQKSQCFLRRRRLHKNTVYAYLWGFSRKAGWRSKGGGLGEKGVLVCLGLRVFWGVLGCVGVFWGVLVCFGVCWCVLGCLMWCSKGWL